MITNQHIIRAFTTKLSPIKIAAVCYKKWMGDVPFIDDLDHYMLEGIVISMPYLFAMAKVIDGRPEDADGNLIGEQPEPVWFVRMAVGNLRTLLSSLPFYLPKICFCRRNDGRLRVYSTELLIKSAMKVRK